MGTLGGGGSWPSVRTVMVRNALTVRPETPIRFAAGLMVANRLTTLPVVDQSGRLVGLVTDAAVIDAVLAWDVVEPGQQPVEAARTVAQLMEPPVVTVEDGSSVVEAANALARNKLSRLVVTHGEYIVGTIGPIDVLAALLNDVEWAGPAGIPASASQSIQPLDPAAPGLGDV